MSYRSKKRDLQSITVRATQAHACHCTGPQDGEPLCPCRMRGVKIRNGRYVEIIDHGPAPVAAQEADLEPELRAQLDATMKRWFG